jgi:hypothetical protein
MRPRLDRVFDMRSPTTAAAFADFSRVFDGDDREILAAQFAFYETYENHRMYVAWVETLGMFRLSMVGEVAKQRDYNQPSGYRDALYLRYRHPSPYF